MNNSNLPYWLTLMVLFCAAYGGWKWYQVEKARPVGGVAQVNLPPLDDFELTERSGAPFRSRDMEGKVWVTTFFFSTCPGSCKRLNANIKYLNTLEEIKDVTWVSITVDPATDTLEVLREYADNLRADPQQWLFCRGDFDYVKRLSHDVLNVGGVSFKDHNDYAVVIDKQGEIRGMFNAASTSDSQRMVKLLRECLAEPWPADASTGGAPTPDDATSGDAEPNGASADDSDDGDADFDAVAVAAQGLESE